MILAWIGIILCLMAGAAGTFGIISMAETKPGKLIGSAGVIAISLSLAGLIFWWLNFTEGGSRAKKSFESETQGGLYRVVKIYDMEGEQIQEYRGKFDIEENQTEGITKIKFDCEGQRHIIYCSTGTVVIDEITEERD